MSTGNSAKTAKVGTGATDDFPRLSLQVRDYRWTRTRRLMEAKGVECLIVPDFHSRELYGSYLSYDNAEGIVIFPLMGEPVQLPWTPTRFGRHQENIRRGETPWVDDTRPIPANASSVVEVLKEKGFENRSIGVVGVDTSTPGETEGCFPYKTYNSIINALPDATFVELSEPFTEMMLVKNDEELGFVRRSARFGEQACDIMIRMARPGASERDIYVSMMGVIIAAGIPPTPHIILHGGRHNLGWGPPMISFQGGPGRILEKGDILLAEIFVRYAGFETQQQMAVALRPVPQILKDLAAVACASYQAGLAILRPGITTEDLRLAMYKPVKEAGYRLLTPLFHTLDPLIWAGRARPITDAKVIEPGMVFEFEPNANTDEDRVNIGGTVIVTESGAEEANKLPTMMQVKG